MKEYKVVINRCFGGFGLSKEAVRLAKKLAPDDERWQAVDEKYYGFAYDIPRHNPILVQVVEELEEKANGECAELKVETITSPLYRVDEYDGLESVETPDDVNWVNVNET